MNVGLIRIIYARQWTIQISSLTIYQTSKNNDLLVYDKSDDAIYGPSNRVQKRYAMPIMY